MKSFLLYAVILFILAGQVYSDEIKTYKQELVRYYRYDDKGNEVIRYRKFSNGIAGCGPNCFTISNEDIIYVCDSCNNRIVKYDLLLNFIEEIKTKNSSYAEHIKITDNQIIYFMSNGSKMVSMDDKGSDRYKIYASIIDNNIFAKNNFFPLNDVLFFYDTSNKLRLIDETGKINESTAAQQKLMKIQTQSVEQKINDNIQNSEIEQYSKGNGLLIINNNLFHPSYNEHKKYFNFKKQIKGKMSVANPSASLESLNIIMDTFIGYDKNNKGYWRGFKKATLQNGEQKSLEIIVIVDSYGNLLDYFRIDAEYYDINVSSSGDIYYMVVGVRVDGVAFYKISCQW